MPQAAQWQEFPLTGPSFESAEEVQLDQWAATVVDMIPMIVEGKLHLLKRPGLETFVDTSTGAGVDGLYWWDAQQMVLVVSDGQVFKITDATGAMNAITGSTDLQSNANVTFADNGTLCAMANGGPIVTTDGSTLTTMADAQAPTAVSHVAYIDGYLLANNVDTGQVNFSSTGNILAWAAADFFTSESRPDDVVAMKEGFREIITLGRESLEFWANDGVSPFSRISGSAQPYGISAPYSLALVGATWMWLSDKRQFVTMQGRQVVPVSSPYDQVLHTFQSVDDAVGYAVHIDGHPIYVLNFPNARQTLAFNYVTQQWHKWGYWDSSRAIYERYRGLSYCYAKAWNMHLVGDRENGLIYQAGREFHTDNGNPIRSLIRSGHTSHGLEVRKQSDVFRLRCKRGLGNASVEDPQVVMRQRVDNKARWSNERWKSLGQVGQHELLIDWRRNGIYRTVQRELIHSDDSDFIVVGAKELVQFTEQ